jgi:hypothetical protein
MRSIALLALVGCLAGAPTAGAQDTWPGSITEARNSAVGFALTMDLVTSSLASTCAEASQDLAQKAPAARLAWKEHNWHLVDSAHKYLLFVRAAVVAQRGEAAGRAFYEEQRARFLSDARTALNDTFRDGGIAEGECETVVTKLVDGSMNFEAKPDFFKALMEIEDAISQMSGQ